MQLQGRGTTVRIDAAACVAAVLFVIAAAGAAPGRPLAPAGGATEAPPAPRASPAPEASPAPSTASQEEPPPRVIRTVCTDHVCGGCDGKCRKSSGHVAVDKKGHCACTPSEGSALDRAIRQAYEKRPPQ